MSNYKILLQGITTFVFDVDGVLTDGSLLVLPSGECLRGHDAKDGYAIRRAMVAGMRIAIITGGVSESIRERFAYFGITDVYMGAHHKTPVFEEFLAKYHLRPEEVAYGGDDLPDIGPMKRCGLPFCPSDAAEEVKQVAKFISSCPGGKGCVREMIEQVMRLQGTWYKEDE